MDPFLEGQVWPELHNKLISELQDRLVPLLRPRYVVRMEEHVYVTHEHDAQPQSMRPDLTILQTAPQRGTVTQGPTRQPVEVRLSMPHEERRAYLEIRFRDTGQVVTVIEVLSPSNKKLHTNSRREYIDKRDRILCSDAHLVEIDLLCGGVRPPMETPLPAADYYYIVSRASRRPVAEVWSFTRREPLPKLSVPLADGDTDACLDMQAVVSEVYDRAGYDYSIDYSRDPEPAMSPEDLAWVRQTLAAR